MDDTKYKTDEEIVMIEDETTSEPNQDVLGLPKHHESAYCDIRSSSNSSEDGVNSFISSNKPGRKTDKMRGEISQRREWNDQEIFQLIQLWKENDILYNSHHPLYYVQTERKVAMDTISDELNINVKDVNDKMHSLRTYYCSQRQRTESALSVNPNDPKALSRWKFYNQMSFLYESVTNRAAKSNINSRSRRKRNVSCNEQPSFLNLHEQKTYTSSTQQHATRTSTQYLQPSTHTSNIIPSSHIPHNLRIYSEQSSPSISYRSEVNRNIEKPSHKYPNCDSTQERGGRKRNIEYSIGQEPTMSNARHRELISSDEMFGHMVANSLTQINDEQQKELLKLEIQTLIYNTRFKQNK